MRSGKASALALICTSLIASPAAAAQSPAVAPAPFSYAAQAPAVVRAPFSSAAQALAFLRDARVVSIEEIPTGVTKPRKVLLEKNDVRAYAVFRDVDEVKERVRLDDGTFLVALHDSALFEVAAYRLAVWLGLDAVPPAVVRSIGNSTGSLQLWIDNAMTETERRKAGLRPPDRNAWLAQMRTMTLFDSLVGNIDRHGGNYLLDETGKLWMIDHTRAFQRFVRGWTPDRIAMCERRIWQRLQQLDREKLHALLGDLLTTFEIKQLAERVDGVVEHIRTQIALRGEDEVIVTRAGEAFAGGGVALGLLAAFGIGQLLAATFSGVELLDPTAPALATALLIVAAVSATTVPALRASRVDPMVALRAE